MEKYDTIKAYCEDNMITVDDLKEMILENALSLGCYAGVNFDRDVHETVHMFNALSFFYEILDRVK